MSAHREPAGSPLAPLGGAPRGPSAGVALALLAAAVVGAIAVALVSSPPALPPPSLAVVPPSASSSAVPSGHVHGPPATLPSPSGAPSAPTSTVVVLRDAADPGRALAELAGCSPLRRFAGQSAPPIKGADVDATAAAAGRTDGWLFVPPGIQAVTRVWLGSDVVELAEAAGRPAVAVGSRGEVWLGGPSGAVRWLPVPTPAGRTAWVMTSDEVTGGTRCGPWRVPAAIGQQRSVTCAAVAAPTCLALAARLVREVPTALSPGGDLALTGTTCGRQGEACTPAVEAAAVPAGWAGDVRDVRAAEALLPGGPFVEHFPGVLPDAALAGVAAPSLPLPAQASGHVPAACGATLDGDLRTAPWDPRVAWVGSTAVVWPPGTSVRFTQVAALTVPTTDGSVRFVAGARVLLRGTLDARRATFTVCAAQSVSALPGGASSGG